MKTVKELYESVADLDDNRMLEIFSMVSLDIGIEGLEVCRHRDGRYFLVDAHGDVGLDEADEDADCLIAEWEACFNEDEDD